MKTVYGSSSLRAGTLAQHSPITTSLLDTDFYKFTMGDLIHLRHAHVHVTLRFKNRTTAVRLEEIVTEQALRWELDAARELTMSDDELTYLESIKMSGKPMFRTEYLDFLSRFHLPRYDLRYNKNGVDLSFSGEWSKATYWEIPGLYIPNELYTRAIFAELGEKEQQEVLAQRESRLTQKINRLTMLPGICFSDFGTRRRAERTWHEHLISRLTKELPRTQFLGTSNTLLAKKFGINPIGTSAHELYMVYAGIYGATNEGLRGSHNRVLRDWWERYGYDLSIALTDTFGSEFFFSDMTKEQAAAWKGLRQDSGDPAEFGRRFIKFYASHGIDPKEKILIWSDGLDLDTMESLEKEFSGRLIPRFGWGTNLTNDWGIKPLSLVIKAASANGADLVKLSDNPAKKHGDRKELQRYKEVFSYQGGSFKECLY